MKRQLFVDVLAVVASAAGRPCSTARRGRTAAAGRRSRSATSTSSSDFGPEEEAAVLAAHRRGEARPVARLIVEVRQPAPARGRALPGRSGRSPCRSTMPFSRCMAHTSSRRHSNCVGVAAVADRVRGRGDEVAAAEPLADARRSRPRCPRADRGRPDGRPVALDHVLGDRLRASRSPALAPRPRSRPAWSR